MAAATARSRRSILGAFTAVLAVGAAGLWRVVVRRGVDDGEGAPPRRGATLSVREAHVPPAGPLVLMDQRCAVLRRGGGFLALDLTCPHQGCVALPVPTGFACPCHDSRFSSVGDVLNPPATRGLRRLAVERRGEMLVVWRG